MCTRRCLPLLLLLVALGVHAPAGAARPAAIDRAYLLAFLACDQSLYSCNDPRNHRVYLAQSNDGAAWQMVPGWSTYTGSVPDVVRRGDMLACIPWVRRYRFSTQTWDAPQPVALTDPEADGYVDPSLFVDAQGRLVLFYLLGITGQDPAHCPPGQPTCVKYFHSATEVAGSDGAAFVADAGDRVAVTIPSTSTSDPDIFYDGTRYASTFRGRSVQVFLAAGLRESYACRACRWLSRERRRCPPTRSIRLALLDLRAPDGHRARHPGLVDAAAWRLRRRAQRVEHWPARGLHRRQPRFRRECGHLPRVRLLVL
jgi:hypothetical protein